MKIIPFCQQDIKPSQDGFVVECISIQVFLLLKGRCGLFGAIAESMFKNQGLSLFD
jgi:hypothetical protein